MEIEFRKYKNEEQLWEDFNKSVDSTFLTSIHWINFQKSLGKEIEQFFIYADNELVGNLYIEISRRKIAKYAYLPYGPILKKKVNSEELIVIYRKIAEFGKSFIKERNLNLFKIDPLLLEDESKVLDEAGFRKSLAPGQAKDTWIMDISGSEIDVLMRQKKETRYYMKRPETLGVTFEKVETSEQVEAFGNLMLETTQRKGFQNYSTEYFKKQFAALHSVGMTNIYLAKYKEKYVAGALFNIYKDKINYSHAASTSDKELAKLASPYGLHWYIIRDAMRQNITKYNFWGVLPENIKNHPWRGLSDFKKKFNGEMKSYVGTYEVYNSLIKYLPNRIYDYLAFKKERY